MHMCLTCINIQLYQRLFSSRFSPMRHYNFDSVISTYSQIDISEIDAYDVHFGV